MADKAASKIAAAYVEIFVKQEKLKEQLSASQQKLAQSVTAMQQKANVRLNIQQAKLASDLAKSKQLFDVKLRQIQDAANIKINVSNATLLNKLAYIREQARLRAEARAERQQQPVGGGPGAGAIAAGVAVGQLGARGLQMAANAAQDLAGSVIAANSNTERLQATFVTFLKTEEAAAAMIGDLRRLANETPFEMPGLASAAQQLLGVGVRAEQVLPMLRKLGDTASVSTDGLEGLPRITRAISQMISKGKIQAEEMLQLAEVGVPAWQVLAQAMGMSVEQLQEMGKAGQLTRPAIDALVEGLGKRFQGSMDRASRTFDGLMSTFRDSYRQFVEVAGKPVFDFAKSGLEGLVDFFKDGSAAAWAETVAGGMSTVVSTVKGAAQGLSTFLSNVIDGTKRWVAENQELVSMAAKIAAGFALAFVAVQTGMAVFAGATAVFGALSTAVTLLLSPLGLLTTALGAAVAAFLTFTSAGDSLADGFNEAVEGVKSSVQSIIEALQNGDVTAAAEIMFASLELEFRKGWARIKQAAKTGTEEALVDTAMTWDEWWNQPKQNLENGAINPEWQKWNAERENRRKVARDMQETSRKADLENAMNTPEIREAQKRLDEAKKATKEKTEARKAAEKAADDRKFEEKMRAEEAAGFKGEEEEMARMAERAKAAQAGPGFGELAELAAKAASKTVRDFKIDKLSRADMEHVRKISPMETPRVEYSSLEDWQKRVQQAIGGNLEKKAQQAQIDQKALLENLVRNGVIVRNLKDGGVAMAGPGGPGGP